MNLPKPEQFNEFYHALHGFDPFPWQTRVAARVCAGVWPRVIALPTAAGKTACLDIAVFALACRSANASRRIFFVVDRRIVVDQAWLHAKSMAKAIKDAEHGILKTVSDSLRDVAKSLDKADDPLAVYALRGGIYRETAWIRSPLQPTIIASTVDQVGSRLLFRGYGVSDSMKPIHAGLVGNDSIILLDEAHCSKPFSQTLRSVQGYRNWNDATAPFHFVSISATPQQGVPENEIERDQDDDRSHPVLGKRIAAKKPATLVVADRAKGKNANVELAKVLEKHARDLASPDGCVGIIVNRVATARDLSRKLGSDAVLLTGRMRPIDRDRLFDEKLQNLLSNRDGDRPRYVIGTQCLEVGADFDFHALVTECASLDALRQRFGRLNRVARREDAKGVVVVRGDQVEPKEKEAERDPIYGNSLALTWKWLNENNADDTEAKLPWIDFGVAAIRTKLAATTQVIQSDLNAPSLDAPVLFPAHLDCWVQTSPIPMPDPDPADFLHGPCEGSADVQVVFRSDLGTDSQLWAAIVDLCPPSTSEAVSVRVNVFRKWLAGEPINDLSGDVEGEPELPVEITDTGKRCALLWRGPDKDKSRIIYDPRDVNANSTYVLASPVPDCEMLGDFPFGASDVGDEAFQRSRDKAILRLPSSVLSKEMDGFQESLTEEIRSSKSDSSPEWLCRAVDYLSDSKSRDNDCYPDGMGGWVVTGKRRLGQFLPEFLNDEESSYSPACREVELDVHCRGVARYARDFAAACGLEAATFEVGGLNHDLGKLDPRFQKMLKGFSGGKMLAKSGTFARRDRNLHNYPVGARHELLSAAMVATKTTDDLLLYLIASHHGSARPFANPVEENDASATPFSVIHFDEQYQLASSAQTIDVWNGDLAERFWRIVRKYGWWGAAYCEAIFRLADHKQSSDEQEKDLPPQSECPEKIPVIASSTSRPQYHPLALPGLDGSNPLAFLAALGTLVVCERISKENKDVPDWLAGPIGLSWSTAESLNIPVLHLPAAAPSESQFSEFIADRLAKTIDAHPADTVVKILTNKSAVLAAEIQSLRNEFDGRPPTTDRRPLTTVHRPKLDWITALICETLPGKASQLQTVRQDYLIGNLRSVMKLTKAGHIERSLFKPWDFADALDNQSLHWEPTEDRRHAYQWHTPSGDPTRKSRGGMLGANRLALEAWPLFPSFANNDRVHTRSFRGTSVRNTYWSWPLWLPILSIDGIASILGLPVLQLDLPDHVSVRGFGLSAVYRCQRILVGKTPNLTLAAAVG